MTYHTTITCDACGVELSVHLSYLEVAERGGGRVFDQKHFCDRPCLWHWADKQEPKHWADKQEPTDRREIAAAWNWRHRRANA